MLNEEKRIKYFIYHIALSHMKKNRERNLCIVISIILVFNLFIAIFSIIDSGVQVIFDQQAISNGYSSHAKLEGFSDTEELKEIKSSFLLKGEDSVIKGLSMEIPGIADDVEILCTTWGFLHDSYIELEEGRMPEKANEVAVDRNTADRIGSGRRLVINDENGKQITKQIVVTGITSTACPAWEGCAIASEKMARELQAEEAFNTELYVTFRFPFFMEQQLRLLVQGTDVSYEKNSAYEWRNFEVNKFEFIVFGIIAMFVMLNGFLLIHNIFRYEMIQDVPLCGLMKCGGMSKRQIRKMLRYEIMILYTVSAVSGCVMGYFIGARWLGSLYYNRTGIPAEYQINSIPFLLAVLFTAGIVFLSVRGTVKTIEKMEAMEAVRFTGNENSSTFLEKKNTRLGFGTMALKNLLRKKKQTFMMIFSTVIGAVLIIAVYTMFGNLNYNISVLHMLNGTDDFGLVSQKASYGTEFLEGSFPDLQRTIIEAVEKLEGVKEVHAVPYFFFYKKVNAQEKQEIQKLRAGLNVTGENSETIPVDILGADRYWYENIAGTASDLKEGSFEPEKFQSGNYVIITQPGPSMIWEQGGKPAASDFNYYHPGDRIDLGTGKKYEVMMVLSYAGMSGLRPPLSFSYGYHVAMDSKEMKSYLSKSDNKASILRVGIQAEEGKKDTVRKELKEISDFENLILIDREEVLKSSMRLLQPLRKIGIILSIVIGIISVFNYINMLIADLISRKYEFTLMECIGMTRKQKRYLLWNEEWFKIFLTLIMSAAIGIPFVKISAGLMASQMGIVNTQFSATIWLLIPLLFLISTVTIEVYLFFSDRGDVGENLKREA